MTSNEPNAIAAESAIRQIGSEFRRLRTVRGERIEDIAAYLDIKVTYLFGIEQGDLSVIPGKRRAKSVLRDYADYLGLDGDSIVAPMDPIIESLEGEKAPPGPAKKTGFDRTAALILAGSVALGVLAGWTWIGEVDQFDLLTPPVAAEAEQAVAAVDDEAAEEVEDAVSTESAEEPESLADDAVDDETEELLARLESALAEPLSLPVDGAAAVDAAKAPEETKEEDPANVLAALVAERGDGAHIYEADNTDARVIIRALGEVSVQVSSPERDYFWTRTMNPKEMMLVPNRSDLELWTGDASSLEVLLDGVVLPPLGPPGTVLSGLSLAPTSLRSIAATAVVESGPRPTF